MEPIGGSVGVVYLYAAQVGLLFWRGKGWWTSLGHLCRRAGEGLRRNASYHPVLKHGPRSLTCVRVLGVNPPARNKRKGELVHLGRILRCTIDRP